MFSEILKMVIGLVLLVGGGELLVRGATRIALLARISPAVVGLTVVAAGTSMPELVVSLQAALQGIPDLSVGNAVGSNVYNIALILGVAAMLRPLVVSDLTLRFEWPMTLAASLALYGLGLDGTLSRLEGVLMFAALVAFVGWSVYRARLQRPDPTPEGEVIAERGEVARDKKAWLKAGLQALGGFALLIGGADTLVAGAAALATAAGISERVIGLTIVAIGTSLPELVTSAVASYRGQADVAVSSVVGSNIFNVLAILGLTAVVTPVPVNPEILASDLPVMLGLTVVLLPMMWGRQIPRWRGSILTLLAVTYTGILLLSGG